MLTLEEALVRILDSVPSVAIESIGLGDAHNRVLAERLVAPIDLPPFDNSSMDGYAVRAADTSGASAEVPVRLRLSGRIAAGNPSACKVVAGDCVRVFTGSPLPSGADAVVMQEDTRVEPGAPDQVLMLDKVKPWENVRFRGEDVKLGTALGEMGDVLTVGRISLLAACGTVQVRVGRQPVVGLVATGAELRQPGEGLAPGQIYESNRIGLAALVRGAASAPRIFPLVTDELAATRSALVEAFSQCDAVITSGGVSVGEMDFVKAAFKELGGELEFWKVAIKPGRPFVFGRWREKLLFGLPGNPVSALVTFLLLVRPALRRWQGAKEAGLPTHPGVLEEPLPNLGSRRHFIRVRVDSAGKVYSAGTQASHVLSSMAAANGLVDVPPETTLPAGATVDVLRWE